MRHRVYGRHLGRDKNQRQALFKSLVHSLFTYGTIQTSEAKAKAIKGLVDKIITLAKDKNSKRLLQSYFTSKALQDRVIKEVAPKLSDRQSGYTSLVKLGTQQGDRTMVVKMSLIGMEKMEPVKSAKSAPIKSESKDEKKDKIIKTKAPKKETK